MTIIQLNITKPIIIIDQSYYIFNRFYATLSWFKKRNYNEIPDENNDEFIIAFFKHFENDMNKLMKKYKTTKTNIIFCIDCSRSNIWRNKIYEEYKTTRIKKTDFDSGIFILFKNYIINNNYYYCECDNLEGDDIVYLVQKRIKNEFSGYKIIILTNDNDYLQMYDNNVSIINMQLKDLSLRIKNSPKIELEYKIIYGDKSDNIPKIQKGLQKEMALKLAVMSKEDRDKYLNDNNLMTNYMINKKLVDLSEIPENLINNFNNKYIIKK